MTLMKTRIKQTEVWLNNNFPTPYPVIVKWASKIAAEPKAPKSVKDSGHYGDCSYLNSNIVIRISLKTNRQISVAVETLLHEWAHACVMQNNRVWSRLSEDAQLEEHPNEFWLAYGKIYREFYDYGGSIEAFRINLK